MKPLSTRSIKFEPMQIRDFHLRKGSGRSIRCTGFSQQDLRALWSTHLKMPTALLVHYAQKLKKSELSPRESRELYNLIHMLLFRLFRLEPTQKERETEPV